jgi:predicted DCC family thiol-disulfide oxidoreductase YuxK
MVKNKEKLTLFYDGGCIVCSREMEKYRLRDKSGKLILIDIAAPTFDPSKYGRDLKTFMAELHVRDESGIFHTGVAAFARIWDVLPQPELHLLSAIISLPGISLLARSGYWLFAHSRKFLPKKTACRDGNCKIK